jgi:signal transduction histidine kinase
MRVFFEVMARQTARLERLIGDLLDATSLRNTQLYIPERVTWRACIADVVAIVRNQFPEHTFAVAVDDAVPAVLADPQRAEQILGNLLANACKYSPLGSTITVTACVVDDHGADVGGRGGGTAVHTTVSDEGPGIPAADRERIFERFTRLGDHMRRTVGGAGLGLFIARQLVETMGGQIAVGDAPSGGAAFTFTLPIAPEDGAAHELLTRETFSESAAVLPPLPSLK